MGDDSKQLMKSGDGSSPSLPTNKLLDLLSQLPAEAQKEIVAVAVREQFAITIDHAKRESQSNTGLTDMMNTLDQVRQFDASREGRGKIEVDGEFKTGSGSVRMKVKKGGFF